MVNVERVLQIALAWAKTKSKADLREAIQSVYAIPTLTHNDTVEMLGAAVIQFVSVLSEHASEETVVAAIEYRLLQLAIDQIEMP